MVGRVWGYSASPRREHSAQENQTAPRSERQLPRSTFTGLPQATEQLAQICLDRIEARKTAVKMRKSASCTVGNSGRRGSAEDELSALADEVCFIRFGRELGRWLPVDE